MSDDVILKQSHMVYSNPYLGVEDRTYSHKGREYRYVVTKLPEFSVVGAVTQDGQILIVRQFRPGPGHYTYDLPAGMIDPGNIVPLRCCSGKAEAPFFGQFLPRSYRAEKASHRLCPCE